MEQDREAGELRRELAAKAEETEVAIKKGGGCGDGGQVQRFRGQVEGDGDGGEGKREGGRRRKADTDQGIREGGKRLEWC